MLCRRSSLLPLPYAFAKTGVLLGVTTMLLVAGCNAASCYWLLRAAHATGHNSYEGVAEAIGGKKWKVRPLEAVTAGSICSVLRAGYNGCAAAAWAGACCPQA